ncbi:hypothetical protein CHS0354_025940 [Potamilus streckersoni]|uniref:Uncharacterized protein n=1 Tax=Potamilus streckersoni TaxID=2493646 RepID=A0AAE0W7J2_9BIVA|nr:hypothetical protein CHS0354_025940 [Potamilus streckersoni]
MYGFCSTLLTVDGIALHISSSFFSGEGAMSVDSVTLVNIQGTDCNYTQEYPDSRSTLNEGLVDRHKPTPLLLGDPYDGNTFKSSIFRHLNPDNIIIPNVEILSLPPSRKVINRFACVTWAGANMYEEENKRKSCMDELISSSQHITLKRNLPVLMSGDFRFPIPELKS